MKLVSTQVESQGITLPIASMYGIFTYIWLISMVNVGRYTIHGSYGKGSSKPTRISFQ